MSNNSNHKFKVGDKVIIRKRSDIPKWNGLMLEHADGKIGIVVGTVMTSKIYYGVVLVEEETMSYKDTSCWYYSEDNLEHYSALPD